MRVVLSERLDTRTREAASIEATRQFHRDWSDRIQRAERAREERDRAAIVAKQAEEHRRSAAQQQAQRDWAVQRNELRDQVAQLRQALGGAEGRILSGELDDAVRAAGEAEVYRMRLAQAEQGFAIHLQQQPL